MKAQQRAIIALYVVSMFMVSMDGTIVNVILPAIAEDFAVQEKETNGINIAYLVSVAISLPIAGYLSNRFGVKKILLSAIALFTLASLACGLASSLAELIAARILQGLSGGIITPVGMALLFRTFPPEERKNLARSLVLPIAFAPAIGPLVGGVLSEYLTWYWAFLINVPIGIVIVMIGVWSVKEFERFQSPFDLKGYLIISIGLPSLMSALSTAASEGFTWKFVLFSLLGVLSLFMFYRYELTCNSPLIDMSLWEDRLFSSLSLVAMSSMGALMGMLYLFPLMYQLTYSASPLESSLITFTEALGLMAASRLLPKTSRRIGMKTAIQGGLMGTIAIFSVIILLGPAANPWILRFLMFGIGLFLGHAVIGSQVSAFNHVTNEQMGKATTLYNMLNRIGAAVGIAVSAMILSFSSYYLDEQLAYKMALSGTVSLLGAAVIFTLMLKTELTLLQGENA